MSKKITIAIRSHISIESIKYLLDSASRGAHYWAINNLGYENEVNKAVSEIGVKIEDLESKEAKEGVNRFANPKIHILNMKKIKRGLTAMAKKEPSHFADFLKENYDETTGDVFLQCCLFGEVIYG